MSQTETVSPGEVCSIDMAKQYGFFDPVTYYKSGYSDTMTYNSKIDTPDKKTKLCKPTSDNKKALPLCTIKYGIPYQENPKDQKSCIINECPPTFTPNKQDKTKCEKPPMKNESVSEPVSKMNRCDEKITDWFTIENYHLGNKYQIISDIDGSNAKCMKPCTGGRVPGYTEDPVDGQSAGLYANTELSKCYPKTEYMGGNKYANTGDYCPIAWVHRFGQTRDDIVNSITSNILDIEKKNGTNKVLDRAKTIANTDATEIINKIRSQPIENVTVGYTTNEILAACTTLHTPERVQKAYDICKRIKDNPAAINTYVTDSNQKRVLKQSCQALFCNKMDDLISTLGDGKTAPCFDENDPDLKPLSDQELFKYDEKNNPVIEVNEAPPEIIEPKKAGKGMSFIKYSFGLAIMILVGIPLLFIFIRFCIWFWKTIFKPYILYYILYAWHVITLKSRAEIQERLNKLQSKSL